MIIFANATSFRIMTKKLRLIELNKITEPDESDSVAYSKAVRGDQRAFDVLFQAQACWNNMAKFRKERLRNHRYCYGEQWKDIINVDGKDMTEEEYIKEQGNIPLQNNLIRRLVRKVVGVYISQDKEPICIARDRDEQQLAETMTSVLQYNNQLNKMSKMNRRSAESFLIGGVICHKKWFGYNSQVGGRYDAWTYDVDPDTFFIDSNMRDYRGWDCRIIGQFYDITFQELCAKFAKTSADYNRLKEIYSCASDPSLIIQTFNDFGYNNLEDVDFLLTNNPSLCKLIEVWKLESKRRIRCKDPQNGELFKIDKEEEYDLVTKVNEERRQLGLQSGMSEDQIPYIVEVEEFTDEYWYYYFLSPFGDILEEGETPYEHKSHPYVFNIYPFIRGEVHSFVGDVIDQQRYTNRLVTMYDWIMRASAKGVLLYPDDSLPDGYSIEDIAEEWSRFNSIILFKPKPGVPLPTQISNNCTNIGISELLNLQLQFFEDITGVNGALQGKPGYAGTSGSLYAQQTQNATTTLLDLLEDLSDFTIDGAYKNVKNIQQCYDEKRYFNVAGKNAMVEYDPDRIRDVDFDLSIVESQTTPTRRDAANQILLEFWKSGQISIQQLLEVGHFDFADELLQNINAQQESLEQGQMPEGVSPELMQQAQQGANMDAVNTLHNAIRQ